MLLELFIGIFFIISIATIVYLLQKNNILNTELQTSKVKIATLNATLTLEQKSANEKLALLQENDTRVKNEFKVLASEIFEQNSKKFSEQNNETLGLILNPMKQQITEFKKKLKIFMIKNQKIEAFFKQN